MGYISIDLMELYKKFHGNSYSVPVEWGKIKNDARTINGQPISEVSKKLGVEVFLPIEFWVSENEKLKIDCCTIRVTSKKTILKTALSERKGTVKRVFNVGDYIFDIKGVLIGEKRQLPDDAIFMLKGIYESDQPVELHNALAEIFMPQCKVMIESIEFPEVEGSLQFRPFRLTCESDTIDTLYYIGG